MHVTRLNSLRDNASLGDLRKSHGATFWLHASFRGVGTGGHAPPPKFFKVPFFVMKSALFVMIVQANVAVSTKLTSKVPFCFEISNFF
jgi:hypothetical protein